MGAGLAPIQDRRHDVSFRGAPCCAARALRLVRVCGRSRQLPDPPQPDDGAGGNLCRDRHGERAVHPRFPGSDKLSGVAYPSLNIRRAGEPPRFAAPDDGFSISLYDEIPELRFGPVVRLQGGRYYSDDRRLVGLRKINWSVEPGFFLEYFPVSFIRARIELRYALNGAEGLVGNAGIDFIAPIDRLTLSVGPRIGFGDANYVRRYFGVTPAEAAANVIIPAPYRPGADVTTAGVLAAASYQWNENWGTTVYGGYNRLIGDAGRSPIPRPDRLARPMHLWGERLLFVQLDALRSSTRAEACSALHPEHRGSSA
jgi:outer membrane scaffolding protein for murein synthesis (MipA/OmpV family)